jgi:transcriptional regulator GlxA family with amidase domain
VKEKIKDIGIVAFNGIERLDIEGPLGVLGWTSKVSGDQFDIRLLSKDGGPVRDHLVNRMITVDGSTKQATGFDLLLVPGGNLSQFVQDKELVDEIRRLGSSSRILASVCTGAFLVAQTGLADGKRMATHWQFRERFRQQFPQITLVERRYVNDGKLWSSAGVSAGIDMSLRLVISIWGDLVAKQVQGVLEYFPIHH